MPLKAEGHNAGIWAIPSTTDIEFEHLGSLKTLEVLCSKTPGITAIGLTSVVAKLASLGTLSCRMNALRDPGTSQVPPIGIEVGRKSGSIDTGSNQVFLRTKTGIRKFQGEGIPPSCQF